MQTTETIKKEKNPHIKIVSAAIILTLLIHGLLLVLFEYSPSKPVYSEAENTDISFMNLASETKAKRQELLNWLEYHEPSMISAPHSKYGYKQLSTDIDFRPAKNDLERKEVLAEKKAKALKAFETIKPQEPRKKILSGDFLFHRLGRIPQSLDIKPASKQISETTVFPQIKADGKSIKLNLSKDLIKEAEKNKAQSMQIGVHWKKSSLLPRVDIEKSSGNDEIDMEVLREIMLQTDNISRTENDIKINIKWRKESI